MAVHLSAWDDPVLGEGGCSACSQASLVKEIGQGGTTVRVEQEKKMEKRHLSMNGHEALKSA